MVELRTCNGWGNFFFREVTGNRVENMVMAGETFFLEKLLEIG